MVVGDYGKLLSEFGMKSMDSFRGKYVDNRYFRRGIVFGHRDFEQISEAIEKRKPYVMMTGLMPSGKMHFGHKMVADQITWYQNRGAELYICAADIESYLMRDVPLYKAKDIAVDDYLLNYIALGLKPENVTFYFQSDYRTSYYRLRDAASKRVTFNELKAIYGDLTPGKIQVVLTQVADIMHPQLLDIENNRYYSKKPVVVPVGADQDPHIRLTRDIASRISAIRCGPHGSIHDGKGNVKEISLGEVECRNDLYDAGWYDPKSKEFIELIQPSATYHKFMSGLGGGKMSSSDPSSYIALATDSPGEEAKKVLRAKTGGRNTVEEQKKLGGVPEECTVYEMFLYHLIDDDKELEKVYGDCESGSLTCGDCKKKCKEQLEKFLTEHQKKREDARKQLDKFIVEN